MIQRWGFETAEEPGILQLLYSRVIRLHPAPTGLNPDAPTQQETQTGKKNRERARGSGEEKREERTRQRTESCAHTRERERASERARATESERERMLREKFLDIQQASLCLRYGESNSRNNSLSFPTPSQGRTTRRHQRIGRSKQSSPPLHRVTTAAAAVPVVFPRPRFPYLPSCVASTARRR